MTNSTALANTRTPGVIAVLDGVRNTGMSAHPPAGMPYSNLVFHIAAKLDVDARALQAEVEAYADALDAHHG